MGLWRLQSAQAHVTHTPSRLGERRHCSVMRSHDFLLSFVNQKQYKEPDWFSPRFRQPLTHLPLSFLPLL